MFTQKAVEFSSTDLDKLKEDVKKLDFRILNSFCWDDDVHLLVEGDESKIALLENIKGFRLVRDFTSDYTPQKGQIYK